MFKVKVIRKYKDLELNESLPVGHEMEVNQPRAYVLRGLGLIEIIEKIEKPKKKKTGKKKK